MESLKDLRYNVMLALYFPILLYAFSTFDLSDESFVVNEVTPVVISDQTVVLGQPFEAKAFLTIGSGEGQELIGAGSLQTVGDSLFQMQTGALLGEDEAQKEVAYSGTFRFPQVSGEIAEMPVTGAFRVRRPEIIAASEATQALYRQSLNTIRFEVPGLEDRQLKLSAGGSPVEGRTINLSPEGNGTTVAVYLVGGNGEEDLLLGRKSFTTIDPPRPEIRVFSAGRELRNGDNLPRARALLEFRFDADEEFKQRFPRDARYGASRARVFLRRGLAASEDLGVFDLDGGSLVLTRALRDARPGDRVMVQLEGVVRINHAGRAIAVPLNQGTRSFGFTIS